LGVFFQKEESDMEVRIESKMGASDGKGSRLLTGQAKETIEDFFRFCPEEVPLVDFVAYQVKRGSNPQLLIKPVSELPAAKLRPGVSVCVHTEGTQGLWGVMSVPGRDPSQLKSLIAAGPFDKRVRQHASAETSPPATEVVEMTTVAAAVTEVVEPPMSAVSTGYAPVPIPATQSSSNEQADDVMRLTPLQKLRVGGFPEEDIERLKATLSVILQNEMVRQGLSEVPNTLRVMVRHITAAIIDHMRLPRSDAGTYRGIVGAFYSSRIRLFALKYDEQEKGDEMYADWLFDCDLVTDFIGGKDQLEALAHVRRQEVSEREAKEATREPAPPTAVVEAAVLQKSLTDEEAVALAHKWLEGKKEAEQAVVLAKENLASHEDRLARLLAQVAEAQTAVEGAKELVKAAEKKFSADNLSDEVFTRLREAKERLVKLCSQFGF
jgi:hypothetical protein